jgi:hypothetical protein
MSAAVLNTRGSVARYAKRLSILKARKPKQWAQAPKSPQVGVQAAPAGGAAIQGLTESLTDLSPTEWQAILARLRRARLLSREDPLPVPYIQRTEWNVRRWDDRAIISQSSVSRVWRHFGIQPHRVRGYMASDDPEFEEKAADIIGLYLKPPVKAAVFCVDSEERDSSTRPT